MKPTGRLFNLTSQERHLRQVGATQRGMILVAAHALAGGDLPGPGKDRDALWSAAAEATLPRRQALIEDAQRQERETLTRAEAKRRRKAEKRLAQRSADELRAILRDPLAGDDAYASAITFEVFPP